DGAGGGGGGGVGGGGQGVVLGVEPIAADLLDELLDVGGDRLEAERPEDFAVQLARLRADANAPAVVGRADRPHFVRKVTDAVIPVFEKPAARLGVDLSPRQLAVLALERPERDR